MDKKKTSEERKRETLRELTLQSVTNKAVAFIESPLWQEEIKPLFDLRGSGVGAIHFFLLAEAAETIKPHLEKELKKAAIQRGVEKITLEDFFREVDPETGKEMRSIFECVYEKYRKPSPPSAAAQREDESEAYKSLLAEISATRGNAPKYFVMPNNLLANALGDLVDAGEALKLPVIKKDGKRKREEITTYAMAEYTGSLKFEGEYTPLHRVFGDALISLWEQDPESAFTAAHVWRAIPGNQDKDPTPDQLAKVEEYIKDLRSLFVKVDATEEMRYRKIIDESGRDANGDKIKVKFREHYVMLHECILEVTNQNGKYERSAYRFASQPVVQSYAQLTGQYITAPAGRLDIKQIDSKGNLTEQQLSNTDDRMVLKHHIYRRIAVMKNDNDKAKAAKRSYDARRKKDPSLPAKALSSFRKQSDKILFKEAFEETRTNRGDNPTAIRKKEMRNREYIFNCLDYWKADGFIKGYKVAKGGRGGKIEGVVIIHE